jgi:hypothetical protein
VSTERPTLAAVIAAHRRFGMQCTCGWSAADLFRTFAESHDRHVADAAREHILGLLADETLVERVEQRPECEHEAEWGLWHESSSHCAPCDLALVAETVRDER